MGLEHTLSLQLDSGYCIDLALPEQRIAILFGGQSQHNKLSHADGTHSPKAETRLRWRQLRAMGWQVLALAFYEWDALADPLARRGFLESKLQALHPNTRE